MTGLCLAAPPPTAKDIEAVATASPAILNSHWGAMFLRLQTGEVLFSRNADSLFTPASNAKLISTAAVLTQLGADYRFRTRLLAARGPDGAGVLHGDLVLAGGGDPTLGALAVPYRATGHATDPLAPLAGMVEQAWNAGLRRVEGDIAGDDTRYSWMPFPEGWAQDDTVFGYGAPVSALTLHDNLFELRVRPTVAGQPPRLDIDPPLPYFTFDNRAVTVGGAAPGSAPAKLYLDRSPGSRHIQIRGTVAVNRTRTYELAVDDPAAYAAFALRELLIRRGIAVTGGSHTHHRPPGQPAEEQPAVELAARSSPPLIEILEVIDKVSHNLWAEMVLREAAHAAAIDDTDPSALTSAFLGQAGVHDTEYKLVDGSGLSRLSLVSPAALVRLLRHMASAGKPEPWLGLLPLAGREGTLENRFRKHARGRIAAKTGTLSGTGALSGYAFGTDPEDTIVFSVLVNNANAPASEIRSFIDQMAELFVP
ncbi:MAG: D-alanyl-D-alanine carboxypeptidase/D-alanyl-D-alanine-endopeptidase [Bryobacteraceae bacterium]